MVEGLANVPTEIMMHAIIVWSKDGLNWKRKQTIEQKEVKVVRKAHEQFVCAG